MREARHFENSRYQIYCSSVKASIHLKLHYVSLKNVFQKYTALQSRLCVCRRSTCERWSLLTQGTAFHLRKSGFPPEVGLMSNCEFRPVTKPPWSPLDWCYLEESVGLGWVSHPSLSDIRMALLGSLCPAGRCERACFGTGRNWLLVNCMSGGCLFKRRGAAGGESGCSFLPVLGGRLGSGSCHFPGTQEASPAPL